MTRPPKRQRVASSSSSSAAASVSVPTPPETHVHALVSAALSALGLDAELLDAEPKLLALRRAPSAIGIGVFTSDVAVRLFHAHGVRCIHSATSTATQPPEDQFSTSVALAAFCVDAMHRHWSAHPQTFATITAIELPDAKAQAAGVLDDRILIKTRQFARVLHREKPLEDRIPVLFQDDTVVAVDKPAGMLSVSGPHDTTESVQSLVRAYYPDARMVHRLDMETSGILVVALTEHAAQHLNKQFRDRTVDKTYLARVCGRVTDDSGVIELCMASSDTERLVQCVVEDGRGAATRTEWRVLERSDDDASTLMELKPVTGKTHQLRVHMQHLGHAILGDSLYSPLQVQHLAPRLLLHAARLSFDHPATHTRHEIHCPCEF